MAAGPEAEGEESLSSDKETNGPDGRQAGAPALAPGGEAEGVEEWEPDEETSAAGPKAGPAEEEAG